MRRRRHLREYNDRGKPEVPFNRVLNSLDPTVYKVLCRQNTLYNISSAAPNESMVSTLHQIDTAIVIFRSMALEKIPNRSKKFGLDA